MCPSLFKFSNYFGGPKSTSKCKILHQKLPYKEIDFKFWSNFGDSNIITKF